MLTALVTIGAILALYVILWLFFRYNTSVQREIVCPKSRRTENVELHFWGFTGREDAYKVKSCSAFSNPKKIECQEECLIYQGRS